MTLRHEANERIEKLTHRMVDSQGAVLLEAGLSIRAKKLHASIGLGKYKGTEVQAICGSFQKALKMEANAAEDHARDRGGVMS